MFEETLAPKTKHSLEVLGEISSLDNFYLAGGTGLALQLGHRISEDLDWFSHQEFKPLQLLSEIKKSQPQIEINNVNQSWGTLKFFHQGTMVSFFTYPYPLLKKPISYQDFKVACIEDIGCMKITSIADRGIKKDFIDLYFLCREIGFEDLLQLFQKKYQGQNIELYHYLKSLAYFEEAENSPSPQMLKDVQWPEIKTFLRDKVKNYPTLD